ncbi:MAG: N-acetyltransferase [Acidobacteria bacterium]|jgi:putative acetyltransferase|nr:N-acetyltransferase [Acidobacteriota bacterium]
MISIRREEPGDFEAVHDLNLAAFEGGPEAALVDSLRASCPDYLSLVAEDEGRVVGHILFTPVVIQSGEGDVEGVGLAPMAVLPDLQGNGIGSDLVNHGLEMLRSRSCPFVIVLGHPDYYPRFGFERASRYDLTSQWEGVPDEAFMILVLQPGVLPAAGGVARYRGEFDAVM